ncbi:hypothetical protein THASP1DRAFT_26947 [Thamnocephalis sphaerospora]|uniref:Uncharacterized protein n=1 Tax=Thamnocephalis sphaerospora TaxID=78915 RepID=A0A4P9XFS2_9FUNG|nr:hypothetical protein THASP1DRAFT_26947 [Thamnocephalis sphaerospora]|eukprot:RKP04432.1 hypothetical protein THASP1DRAFT_26947 [Thamnocephalis sphaerospora]
MAPESQPNTLLPATLPSNTTPIPTPPLGAAVLQTTPSVDISSPQRMGMLAPSQLLDAKLWETPSMNTAGAVSMNATSPATSVADKEQGTGGSALYSDAAMAAATDLTMLAGLPAFSFDADPAALSSALTAVWNSQQFATLPLDKPALVSTNNAPMSSLFKPTIASAPASSNPLGLFGSQWTPSV